MISIGKSWSVKNDYQLRRLDDGDETKIQDLFQRCSDYFLMVEGRPAKEDTAQEFFRDLPPQKDMEDKIIFGLERDNQLFGVIEVIRDFPVKREWIIGLMLLDSSVRGKGLGKTSHDILGNWVREQGGEKLRIGVVEQNRTGMAFWKSIGYEEIMRTEPRQYGEKESIVIVMNYYL